MDQEAVLPLVFMKCFKKPGQGIIVEGKKDKAALASLGIAEHVVMINSRPLYAVIDEVALNFKEAIILTDLDHEGKKLYGMLQHQLKRHGVKINNQARHYLFKQTPLKHIEGMATYFVNKSNHGASASKAERK